MKRDNKNFEEILKKALDLYAQEESKKLETKLEKVDLHNIEFSDTFKRRMNALFHECGINCVPHPEVE